MLAKKKKRMTATAVLAILLIALISWIWWANTALELNIYRIASGGLPDGFDGYRIAHVSDLHNGRANIPDNSIRFRPVVGPFQCFHCFAV